MLKDKILKLKGEKDVVILAHNYQIPEVQDIADFVGDSLGLARQAANTDTSKGGIIDFFASSIMSIAT